MNQTISPVKYVLARLKRDKVRLARAVFWAILVVIIPMQVPILTGALIDGIHGKEVRIYGFIELHSTREEIVNYLVIALIIIGASYGIAEYFRSVSLAKVSRHFVSELRKDLVRKLEALSLDIHAKYGPGELLNRAILDTQFLRSFIDSSIVKTFINIVRTAYPLVMLFILDPFLASLASSILPAQWLITRRLQKKLHTASRQARTAQANLTTILKENLDGIETIQTSQAEIYSIGKISEATDKVELDQILTQRYSGMIAGFVFVLTGLGVALVWWQGGLSILAGHMTVGKLVAFTGLMFFVYESLRNSLKGLNEYQKGVVAIERIQEILDTPSSVQESPNAIELAIQCGKIEFRNVCFSYPRSQAQPEALTNINVSIEPNMLVGIVGKSGSGKSSILKLITRLHDPSEGQILIDGHDIKEVKLESLRSQIAVVPQIPMIFSGTVSENIRLAKPDGTDEEVEEACRSADALKFIVKLDKGLNTRLGQGAVNLSGGEAQRIAIARALIRKPKILLLDEPSSALDSESESAIMATLDRLKNNMAIILVGHHLSAINKADRIIVIDNGKVVEDGSHKELLSSRGLYSLLYLEDDLK